MHDTIEPSKIVAGYQKRLIAAHLDVWLDTILPIYIEILRRKIR